MVVHDLNVGGVSRLPLETHTPLIAYTNAVLTATISRELLQAIARWRPQILDRIGSVQEEELLESRAGKGPREFPRPLSAENLLCLSVAKGLYHWDIVTPCGINGKRHYLYSDISPARWAQSSASDPAQLDQLTLEHSPPEEREA